MAILHGYPEGFDQMKFIVDQGKLLQPTDFIEKRRYHEEIEGLCNR